MDGANVELMINTLSHCQSILYNKCGIMANRYVNNKAVYLRNKMADLC